MIAWSYVVSDYEVPHPCRTNSPTASRTLRRLALSCGHFQMRTMGQKVPNKTRCRQCERNDIQREGKGG